MISKKVFVTNSPAKTRKLGELMAKELRGGEIVCLVGELGSGKTTFAQGMLRGLGAKGPYTSPTFLVIKHYKKEIPSLKSQYPIKSQISKSEIRNIYHIDAYRVGSKDVLNLGWEEIIGNKNSVVIVEWAERIRAIVPKRAIWLKFEHLGGNERKIIFSSKLKTQNSKPQLKAKKF